MTDQTLRDTRLEDAAGIAAEVLEARAELLREGGFDDALRDALQAIDEAHGCTETAQRDLMGDVHA